VLFQPGYLQRLIEIGEADAEKRSAELLALVDGEPVPVEQEESDAEVAPADRLPSATSS